MPSEPQNGAGSPATDAPQPSRALLERIQASPDLSRSPRLRQLFVYLCEKGLAEPGASLSEEQIGVEVFGRARGYDTGTDTIVRVQVSQLRKRLEHYFLSEGLAEPVIIDLPKRSYTPVFRPREQGLPEKDGPAEPVGKPRKWKVVSLGLAMLLAACLVSVSWLIVENGRLRERLSLGPGRAPFRDHFWSQLFRSGRPTQLVASDANAMVLCDFLRRTLTPAEYAGSGYPYGLIDSQVRDASTRRALRSVSENYLANMPDLRVTHQLSRIAALSGGRMNVVYARDFRYQPQTPDNLIFLGHRKANPWVALFEERMNFRYHWDVVKDQTAIVNLAPAAGEQARYPVEWGVQTYALIALMRKPVGEGTVLLLEGTDTGAVEAGCNLLTDEARIRSLYDRLGMGASGPVPEFEIVLRAKLVRNHVRDYEIVAHRFLATK